MSEYTPTTNEVLEAWAAQQSHDQPTALDLVEAYESFKRWIADHDARVLAEALRDAADDLDSNFQDLPGWDKAYRNGTRTRDWENGAITIVGDVIRKLRDRATRVEWGESS